MAIYDLLYASVNPIAYIDGISVVNATDYFVQTNPPLLFATGDIWFNPSSNTRYIAINGQWVLDDGTGTNVYGAHLSIIYSDVQPNGSSSVVGDYWYKASTNTLYQWNASTWVVIGGSTTATTAPTNPALNDTWYNSADKTLYKWNGYTWVAQTSTAPPTTPTKTPTTISDTAPTNPATGDMWYSNATGILSRWSGTTWVAVYGVKSHFTTVTGFTYKQLVVLSIPDTKLVWKELPVVVLETSFSYAELPLVTYGETFPYEEIPLVPFDLVATWDVLFQPLIPVAVTTQFGYAFASPYINDRLDVPYSILTTRLRFPLTKTLEADYAIPTKVFASNTTAFNYSGCIPLSSTTVFPYSKPTTITSKVVAPYGNASKINIRGIFDYSGLATAKSTVALNYSLVRPITVKVTTSLPYRSLVRADLTPMAFHWIHTTEVKATTSFDYEISNKQYVFIENKFGYSISNTNVQTIETTPEMLKGTESISYIVVNLSTDESSPYWMGSVTLANLEDFSKFNVGDTVTFKFVDQEFHMLVDNKTLSREDNAAQACVLTLISLTALHDNPFTGNVTKFYDTATSAKQVVEDLLGPVEWNIPDWLIPLEQCQFTGSTPLSIARKVVSAIGGLIETMPDGSLLVRMTYPVSIPDYATTDAYVLSDSDLFRVIEDIAPTLNYNRVTLYSNIAASSFNDFITFTSTDPIGNSKGYVDAYPSPYRDVNLSSTGTAKVVKAYGTQTRQETEYIEFKSGKATSQYPIESIVSMQWDTTNLGGVTYSGKNLSSAILAESLLKITYTTKYQMWDVAGSDITQFVLSDA